MANSTFPASPQRAPPRPQRSCKKTTKIITSSLTSRAFTVRYTYSTNFGQLLCWVLTACLGSLLAMTASYSAWPFPRKIMRQHIWRPSQYRPGAPYRSSTVSNAEQALLFAINNHAHACYNPMNPWRHFITVISTSQEPDAGPN